MSLGYLPTPCDTYVFFTLPHGASLQTPFSPSLATLRDGYGIWIALCEVLSEAFGLEIWEDICESWQRFLFLCARHMLNGTKDLPEPALVEGYPASIIT